MLWEKKKNAKFARPRFRAFFHHFHVYPLFLFLLLLSVCRSLHFLLLQAAMESRQRTERLLHNGTREPSLDGGQLRSLLSYLLGVIPPSVLEIRANVCFSAQDFWHVLIGIRQRRRRVDSRLRLSGQSIVRCGFGLSRLDSVWLKKGDWSGNHKKIDHGTRGKWTPSLLPSAGLVQTLLASSRPRAITLGCREDLTSYMLARKLAIQESSL